MAHIYIEYAILLVKVKAEKKAAGGCCGESPGGDGKMFLIVVDTPTIMSLHTKIGKWPAGSRYRRELTEERSRTPFHFALQQLRTPHVLSCIRGGRPSEMTMEAPPFIRLKPLENGHPTFQNDLRFFFSKSFSIEDISNMAEAVGHSSQSMITRLSVLFVGSQQQTVQMSNVVSDHRLQSTATMERPNFQDKGKDGQTQCSK